MAVNCYHGLMTVAKKHELITDKAYWKATTGSSVAANVVRGYPSVSPSYVPSIEGTRRSVRVVGLTRVSPRRKSARRLSASCTTRVRSSARRTRRSPRVRRCTNAGAFAKRPLGATPPSPFSRKSATRSSCALTTTAFSLGASSRWGLVALRDDAFSTCARSTIWLPDCRDRSFPCLAVLAKGQFKLFRRVPHRDRGGKVRHRGEIIRVAPPLPLTRPRGHC